MRAFPGRACLDEAGPRRGFIECLICDVCMAGHPVKLRHMANRIVPKVRLADDADFFAAWNLDHPGMEKAKAAVLRSDSAGRLVKCSATGATFLRFR